jgi:hypothetical protein
MIRILHIVAIIGLIASAVYAYSIKYETIFHAEQLAKLKNRIAKEHDTIAVLKAEWQLLNRPDRLQVLSERHLSDMQPLNVNQLARLSDIPERGERGDEIGRKLEALGLMPPTSTGSAAPSKSAKPLDNRR